MSIERCEKHSRHWDSDKLEGCPICLQEESEEFLGREALLEALLFDTNREMDLPDDDDDGDW